MTAGITWKILSQSYFNEDTGETRLRLTHTLTADVLVTDEITFESALQQLVMQQKLAKSLHLTLPNVS